MDNPSSSPPPPPPPPLPPPNPPQPQSSSPASNAPSPSANAKPNLEPVPSSAAGNPNPDPNTNQQSPPPTTKKSPPLPWTHQETVSLIQTYQEKWYALKKGQLKANQWEDVAAAVAARCGYDAPSKTATQCRHKIEKLRKRYRAELHKPYPNSWQYFEPMDRMERGPMAITARPLAVAVKYQNQKHKETESDDGEGNYAGLEIKKNKLKSINNIVRGGNVGASGNGNRNHVSRIGMISRNLGDNGRALKGLRTSLIQKRKGYFRGDPESDEEDDGDDDDDDDEEEEELEEEEEEEQQQQGVEGKGGGGRVVVGKELAAEIRGFADRFMRMENEKIEMMRETERFRMEMEKRRMDMIVEAQRKVVDTIGRAFGAHKKVKVAQET